MIEFRAVWKDLESRSIRKSLEMELGLGDDVKGHGFLIVCICIAEIKGMTSEHMWEAWWP